MPKLPVSGPGGGPNVVPLQTDTLQQSAYPLRRSEYDAREAGNLPNVLGQTAQAGANIANQLQGYEQQNQAKEDAIAMSQARTAYFQDASNKFDTAEMQGLTSKPQFDDLSNQLAASRDNAIANFTGSDDAKARLLAQLNEAHVNFGMKALAVRQRQVTQQFDNEFLAGTNRLASGVIDHPTTLQQQLDDGQVMLDSFKGAMPQQEYDQKRQQLRSVLTGTAAEQFIASGQPDAAQAVLNAYGDDMSPNQHATYQRHIDALKAPPAPITPYQQEELNLRRQELGLRAGQQQFEQGATQQRLGFEGQNLALAKERFATESQQSNAKIALSAAELNLKANQASQKENPAQTKFQTMGAESLGKQLDAFDAQYDKARDAATNAQQIETMLKGVPGGSISTASQNWLKKQFNLDPEQTANIEGAKNLAYQEVLKHARELAPVSDSDIRTLLNTVTPSDAQTPLGRAKIVYIMQRQKDYANAMSNEGAWLREQVGTGTMDQYTANRHLKQYQAMVDQKFHQSFAPPTSVGAQQ